MRWCARHLPREQAFHSYKLAVRAALIGAQPKPYKYVDTACAISLSCSTSRRLGSCGAVRRGLHFRHDV
eukprot:6179422-Pleurochrysis_carterae.AAC.1